MSTNMTEYFPTAEICLFSKLSISSQNDYHDYANFTERKISFVLRSPCKTKMP